MLNRILESLVQSAAAYSLAAIAVAISSVVPQIPSNFASWDAAENYAAAMFDFISVSATMSACFLHPSALANKDVGYRTDDAGR